MEHIFNPWEVVDDKYDIIVNGNISMTRGVSHRVAMANLGRSANGLIFEIVKSHEFAPSHWGYIVASDDARVNISVTNKNTVPVLENDKHFLALLEMAWNVSASKHFYSDIYLEFTSKSDRIKINSIDIGDFEKIDNVFRLLYIAMKKVEAHHPYELHICMDIAVSARESLEAKRRLSSYLSGHE